MTRLDQLRSRELPDIVDTGANLFQTLLDTVTFALDLPVGEIDFGSDAGNVKASSVSEATIVLGFEAWADPPLTMTVMVVVSCSGEVADCKHRGEEGGD